METVKTPKQILETSGLFEARQITQPRPPSSIESAQKKSDWLNKWLRLKVTHPQLRQVQDSVYDLCAAYAKTPGRGCTTVIFGENGSGKSHIAKRICNWAGSVSTRLPLVDRPVGMGCPTAIKANWPAIVDGFKKDEWAIIDDLAEANLLILDDIGAEHDPSKIGVEKLYILLSGREFKWNIITTNHPPGEWESKFERRISSRLFRNAQHIDLSQVPDFSTT